jgi:uncharacterized protein
MPVSRRDVLLSSAALLTTGSKVVISGGLAATAGGQRWQLPDKNSVKVIDNQWIELNDGTKLSARLWLPESAGHRTVPVVWEYIPYRKRDLYRAHDDLWGQQLAQYGVAYARVDVRGSGDSQGTIVDEYLDQELNDGVEVIAWLARQPWSNGAVGMRGISWGGINTLQIAALAPPALKAIMPMCCTDTRYVEDAHYIGGALGLTDLQWGVQFKGVMALPPDPAIVGGEWRELWQQRLDATPAIINQWLEHQRNDAFWKRGSVSSDYGAIRCPVYIVDGWVDTYVNTVGRILAHIKTPHKALIGPWAHNYPEDTSPGPSLDWAYEELRWWKQWLEAQDTGIMDEPKIRVYMPYRTGSEVYPKDTPGRWVAENTWPPPSIVPRTWYLCTDGLSEKASERTGRRTEVHYLADKIVGLQKPEWLPFPPEGMPGEQTPDDVKSLVFDSAPLKENMEILGHPTARIRVAADRAVAKLALRLCEVTPDGRSWLVTYGLLNLTHRGGDEAPAALVAGMAYDVTVELSLIAHRFKRGNRIRLSVSESLWPLVWPSPEIVTLTLTHGASSLELPTRPPVRDPAFPIPIVHSTKPPETRRALPQASGPDPDGWYKIVQNPPAVAYPIAATGTMVTGILGQKEELMIKQGDNTSCVWRGEWEHGFKRADWNCSVFASYRLTSTTVDFVVEETLRASVDDKVIFERSNKNTIRRDSM